MTIRADYDIAAHQAQDTGGVAAFLTREEAAEAVATLNASDRFGWRTRIVFTAAWGRFIVYAERKTRSNGNSVLRTDGTVR